MKKRILSLVTILAVTLAGCGGSGGGGASTGANSPKPNNNQTQTGTNPSAPADKGTIQLTFWHAMGGANEAVVKQVVQHYNDTAGKEQGIAITPVFQGSYQDLMKKVRAAVQAKDTKNLPDIVQVPASDTAYIKDVPSLVPAHVLIAKDSSFNIKDLEPNALASFSFKGEQMGVPFANSTILLYYNKKMFEEASLDPAQPPATIDELGQYALKLTKKNGDQVAQWGFSGTPDLWHMSSWIGMQGAGSYIGNNKNGREDTMTEIEFDSTGTMKQFLTEWKKAIDYGGIQTGTDANTTEEFAAGKLAMFLASTAALRGVLNAVGDKFEVGTAFLPRVQEGDQGGVAVGGSALYVMDRGDQAKIDAAWEYLKFSVSPETQLMWHTGTGYFPVNTKTYDLPQMKEHLDKNKLFQTAIDQLHASSPETQEPLVGVPTEFSRIMKEEILAYVLGRTELDTAVQNMAEASNKALQDYNKVNKK
ncbi:ABC transporter substrate-binding protein [Paenibacillus sp. J2TS4]|uniref:ABC transporter substrate-binding protein n=1 Tax=Paenibacillus sp. J2TS4 TaxID=2807194 RepID=UPI001B24D146|nr:ABC transporter substrate-binding protein [Paenibacillus sp. J2TS4]GIP34704.1 ABC transporter substrate-binding protein [Paenibacillus sp. J2TS4]